MVPLVTPNVEPPPVSSFETHQSEAVRAQHDGVIRRWLSSMRPLYRHAVKGRTGLVSGAFVLPQSRHRAA